MKKIISVINQKGGVGKSTITKNMAIYLAMKGERVLVIDNDQQGNTSAFFGIDTKKGIDGASMAELYLEPETTIESLIHTTNHDGVSIIPANFNLNVAKSVLPSRGGNYQIVLRDRLNLISDNYDFVIVDNQPSADVLTMNCLVASDIALVICKADRESFDGVDDMRMYFDEIQPYNDKLITVCLFNQYRTGIRNNISYLDLKKDNNQYVHKIMDLMPVLPVCIRNAMYGLRSGSIDYVAEANNVGKAVFELSPRCGFALDFKNVMKYLEKTFDLNVKQSGNMSRPFKR